jgi:hypothetical protein
MQGIVLSDYELVKKLIAKTKTKEGLKVILKKYCIGIRTPKEEVDYEKISFNPESPKLCYRIAA